MPTTTKPKAREARKLTVVKLAEMNLTYESVKAKTVSFAGLGYGSAVWVTINKLQTQNIADVNNLKAYAKENAFFVECSVVYDIKLR